MAEVMYRTIQDCSIDTRMTVCRAPCPADRWCGGGGGSRSRYGHHLLCTFPQEGAYVLCLVTDEPPCPLHVLTLCLRPVICCPLMGTDALEGKGPQRRPQRRLDRRLEEVAEAVAGGYCWLQMSSRMALGVRGTVAGHRLGALEGGGTSPPSDASLLVGGLRCARGGGAGIDASSPAVVQAHGPQRRDHDVPGAADADRERHQGAVPAGRAEGGPHAALGMSARRGGRPHALRGLGHRGPIGCDARGRCRVVRGRSSGRLRGAPRLGALGGGGVGGNGSVLRRGGGGGWRSGAPWPHTHGNVGRQVADDRRAEVCGQRKPSNEPHSNQHSPGTPTTALRERGNDTSRSTGGSSRQNAATRRSMRREGRVTVQGPVKKQQPDGMSHRGGGGNPKAAQPSPKDTKGGPHLQACIL